MKMHNHSMYEDLKVDIEYKPLTKFKQERNYPELKSDSAGQNALRTNIWKNKNFS